MTVATGGTYQAAVAVWFRGPDFAFAVRQGDLAALERAMRVCSRYWNGANSLIIPIARSGRPAKWIEECLKVRPVEVCFVDPDVDRRALEQTRERLRRRVAHWSGWRAGQDPITRELSPVHHGWSDDELTGVLPVPTYRSARLRRIAVACWGDIAPDSLGGYERTFRLREASDDAAHYALLAGQLVGNSPLELSLRVIRSYQTNGSFERALFVFRNGSFNELVHFWNLRSRTRSHSNRPLMLGVPREAVAVATLRPLAEWILRERFIDVEPDLGVIATERRTGGRRGA